MKVLWLCSVVLPQIAQKVGLPTSSFGGWLTGAFHALRREHVSLCYCAPIKAAAPLCGNADGVEYCLFPQELQSNVDAMQRLFAEQLRSFAPEVVHIFGTEFSHTLAMLRACEREDLLEHTLVHIQGLISICAKHYLAYLPSEVIQRQTLRDRIKRSGLLAQQRRFSERGKHELSSLKLARHVCGRTDWDRACMQQLAPQAKYHFCNETLRPSFYENKWSLESCRRHSIFISQSNYPIKGFHLLLQAMPALLRRYPDLLVCTTGKSPLVRGRFAKARQTAYQRYAAELMEENGLQEHIRFLGVLSEEQMCAQYLQSHVFLSPSSIENSPNSVGEAMLLGVPVVSSNVGGAKNLLADGEEGFLYPADESYMIPYYIGKIFDDDALAKRFSARAREHAARTHSPETNAATLLKIYEEVRA